MIFGKSTKQYSGVVRAFCLTLHFYSPKAYEYLRSVFDSNLPSVRTLRMWYSSINGSPGFTSEALDVLRSKVEKEKVNNKQIVVSLIHDEMAIRKHSQWDNAKRQFVGHITAGSTENENDPLPLAREALVFLVNGVGNDFKIPIGYFLLNGLTTIEKAALLKEAIFQVSQTGVKLAAVTFEGLCNKSVNSKITRCRLF